MAKRVQISYPDEAIVATALLLEDRAPATCAALWRQLSEPLTLTGSHAMWTGPEVSAQIPDALANVELSSLPVENGTVFPPPGSLLWAYVDRFVFGGNPLPVYDIGVFYGPQARIFLPIGWLACSHFAQLEGDWEAFRDACARTRSEGSKQLRLERLS